MAGCGGASRPTVLVQRHSRGPLSDRPSASQARSGTFRLSCRYASLLKLPRGTRARPTVAPLAVGTLVLSRRVDRLRANFPEQSGPCLAQKEAACRYGFVNEGRTVGTGDRSARGTGGGSPCGCTLEAPRSSPVAGPRCRAVYVLSNHLVLSEDVVDKLPEAGEPWMVESLFPRQSLPEHR
jgi:hypothetical protein